MESLDIIVRMAEIVLFVVLSILTIYLIFSLKRITRSVEQIEKNIDNLEKKVEPVLENALVISGNVKEITTDIKTQISKVDGIIESVKDTTDSIIQFEQSAQKRIETEFNDTLNFISAIITGIKTFLGRLKSTHHNGNLKSDRRSLKKKIYQEKEDTSSSLTEFSEEDF